MNLRCIHRHTIVEHPMCFLSGKIKYEFKDDREWEKLMKKPWWTFPEYRIGYLDIETDNLHANFGTMLSWAIKEKGGGVTSALVTRQELYDGEQDKRLTKQLLDELTRYKIVCTYYGTGFDLPFARTKALYYGFNFPSYNELYHFDLFYTVKAKLKLHKNSLAAVCGYLGIEGKTPIDYSVWYKARYGDKAALNTVLEHNIGDVIILEKLHDRLIPFRKWLRKSI